MTTPLLALAIWLATLAAVAHCRRKQRQRNQLTYGYQLPQPKGLVGLGASMARSVEAMTWGSSYQMWRARCDASLRASHRRRGLSA